MPTLRDSLRFTLGRGLFIGDFMEIEISNWKNYNPRNDLKSMPWFRISSDIGSSESLFGLDPACKWLFIFLLGQSAKKISSELSLNIEYVAAMSGVAAKDIPKYLKQLETNELITCHERIRSDQIGNVPKRREEKRREDILSSKLDHVQEIVDYMNQETGKSFKAETKSTKSKIKSRLSEKYTVKDFKTVIDLKASQWKNNPKMNKFLRPETLFGQKFESYLEESKQVTSNDEELMKILKGEK